MKLTYVKITFLLVVAALLVISCDREPEACFTLDQHEVIPGQLISITNCSKEAFSYDWDFGDGGTGTSMNPSISYNEKGEYTIKLTAFSKREKKSSEVTARVKIGDRYLTKIEVLGIDNNDKENKPWDQADGPDMKLFYGISLLVNNDPFPPSIAIPPNGAKKSYVDVSNEDFPLEFDVSADNYQLMANPEGDADNAKLKSFYIDLLDEDFGTLNRMIIIGFDPLTTYPENPMEVIAEANGKFKLNVHYEIR